jgi:ubiquitin carboxyl-terminal hydrolase 36/42
MQGFCAFCALERHVIRAVSGHGQAFSPKGIVQHLKRMPRVAPPPWLCVFMLISHVVIARHMRFGRQEDAHEFLRYLMDGLQKGALSGLDGCVFPLPYRGLLLTPATASHRGAQKRQR